MSDSRKDDVKLLASGASRGAGTLHLVFLVALLAIACVRTTLNEVTFSSSALADAGAFTGVPVASQIVTHAELLRVSFAVAILAIAAAWAIALLLHRRPREIHLPMFGVWIAVLAVCLFASAAQSADKRTGMNIALEQTSLLLAAFILVQIARPLWRRRLVLVVLAAAALMLGAKGLYQVGVEIPDQTRYFEQDATHQLASVGHQAGTPAARMFETRLRESTAKGWFGLANVYGSLMTLLTLAAAGLALDKWRTWQAARNSRSTSQRNTATKSGEIPISLLAAALSTLAVLPAALALWLTGSTGAIFSGIISALLAAALYWKRDWAVRNRTTLLRGALCVLIAGAIATVALGIGRGGLPSKSLQVRWEYWRSSLQMLGDHRLLGVGPGSFGDAYLRYRLPGAEEEVKNPHNVVMHALAEYGLAGGLVFLALLAYVLAKLAAPAAAGLPDENTPRRTNLALLLLALWALAVGIRISASNYPNGFVLLYDNFLVMLALGMGLAVAAWQAFLPGQNSQGAGDFARIALACGIAGFALHNLSDFALFLPGAAMLFWIAAGSILAGVQGRTWRIPPAASAALAGGLVFAALVAAATVLLPVARKTAAVAAAAENISQSQPQFDAAAESLRLAVDADPLDSAPAADLTNVRLRQAQFAQDGDATQALLAKAQNAAAIAIGRNRARPASLEAYLRVRSYRLDPSLLTAQWDNASPNPSEDFDKLSPALQREPENVSLLNRAAMYAYQAGQYEVAAELLRRATKAAGDGSPLLWDHFGDALCLAGHPEEAKRAWQRFLSTRLQTLNEWAALVRTARSHLDAMDPQAPRLHLRLSQLAWQAGRTSEAGEELHLAGQTEQALRPESVLHFTPEELSAIAVLRAKIAAVTPPAPAPRPDEPAKTVVNNP